jgi:hypothetical protein
LSLADTLPDYRRTADISAMSRHVITDVRTRGVA